MKDCVNNSRLIKACLNQFREEFYPIIKKEDLLQVNLEDIKGSLYETQECIGYGDTGQRGRVEFLLKMEELKEEGDVSLEDLQLSTLEKQFFDLYSQGITNTEITKIMSCSLEDVKLYVDSINNKFGSFKGNESFNKKANRLKILGLIE